MSHRRSLQAHGGPPLRGRPQGDANQSASGRSSPVVLSAAKDQRSKASRCLASQTLRGVYTE
jgi:hypothetical protein